MDPVHTQWERNCCPCTAGIYDHETAATIGGDEITPSDVTGEGLYRKVKKRNEFGHIYQSVRPQANDDHDCPLLSFLSVSDLSSFFGGIYGSFVKKMD